MHGANPSAQRDLRAALTALPSGDYPELSAGADEVVSTLTDDAQFDYGLERLLDGIEARLASAS